MEGGVWEGYSQVLDHVVLDQRVASPSVDGQVAVALGREAAAVVDGADRMSVRRTPEKKELRSQHSPTSAWVPSLATNKVAGVPPGDGVAAALQVGVGGVSAAVSPPRVEVAVVGSLSARSGTLLDFLDQSRVVGIVTLVKEVEWCGDDASHSRQGEEKRLDGNHGESWRLALFNEVVESVVISFDLDGSRSALI
jgi:hypothetical protein